MNQNVLQNIKLSYKKMLFRTLTEDKVNSLLLKLKKVTIKDVIYWVAKSWNHLSQQFSRESWQQLRLSLI